jgi:ribosome-associated protein
MKKTDPSRELAIAAADLAADGKALDISILELREISSVADYFVVASGRSHIQVESICDRIVEGIRERLSERPIAVEGLENSQWAVLDYGSVVIHVFQEGVRKLYDLERLWSLAPSWKHGQQPPTAAVAKAALKAATGKDAAKPAVRAAARKSAESSVKPSEKKPATARSGSKPATKRVVGKSPAKSSAKTSAKSPVSKAAGVKAKASGKATAKKLSEAEAPADKPAGTRSRVAAG